MEKTAIIDIGSNSVRLMMMADGKVLYKALNTTRLGEGIALSLTLKKEAMARTAAAVSEFSARAKSEGATKAYAFATAAVRSAQNGAQFISLVKELCGVDVEIISGEEEAEIGILGALGSKDGSLIDVGGASTEIIAKKSGKIVYEKSVNIGIVRLKDMCGRDAVELRKASEAAVDKFGKIPFESPVYAIGGTATTLAAVLLGMDVYDSARITGTVIPAEELRTLADRLTSMGVEEIAALRGVPKGRADVIGGGAVLLSVIADKFSLGKIIVSDSDNLEGYALRRGLV